MLCSIREPGTRCLTMRSAYSKPSTAEDSLPAARRALGLLPRPTHVSISPMQRPCQCPKYSATSRVMPGARFHEVQNRKRFKRHNSEGSNGRSVRVAASEQVGPAFHESRRTRLMRCDIAASAAPEFLEDTNQEGWYSKRSVPTDCTSIEAPKLRTQLYL